MIEFGKKSIYQVRWEEEGGGIGENGEKGRTEKRDGMEWRRGKEGGGGKRGEEKRREGRWNGMEWREGKRREGKEGREEEEGGE